MNRDEKVKFTVNGIDFLRQPTEIYTRVMWYYRPVTQFNNWKKAEFYGRKYFDEMKSFNSSFIKDFTV